MDLSLASLVGYLATAVLLASFMLSDLRKLRILNSLGCAIFIVYGFLLAEIAWPVIVTNFSIIMINFYYLFFKGKKA